MMSEQLNVEREFHNYNVEEQARAFALAIGMLKSKWKQGDQEAFHILSSIRKMVINGQ
tara:strand:+ start:586 stop:759 length:174 start_codon:yes stop_codon:yes gene_type:complete